MSMADLYPKYYKDVRHLDSVDVYRVHRLFNVTDNELHHASKKILLCGVRTGGKPARKEIEEARDTLNRWLEIQDEDQRIESRATQAELSDEMASPESRITPEMGPVPAQADHQAGT